MTPTRATLHALVISAAVLGAAPGVARQTAPAPDRSARKPVAASQGMVASAHPLASEAGVAMLRKGGNAIDAAVAAALAIGVVEPNASSLGGEGLMVIYLAREKKAVAIDYRSTLPAGAVYDGRPPDVGYAAVAVPGTVAGLAHALERYGTRPFSEAAADAVRLAEEGFVIGPTLAGAIADNFEAILGDEPLAAIVCPEGLPLEAGARLTNKDLARTLRTLAADGPGAFYRGAIGTRIAEAMAAHGGFVTKGDLDAYRAIEREPVRGRYRGLDVVSGPPPVGGVALIATLQMLDTVDLKAHAPLSPERAHLTTEALKRAFADYSAYVADPGFVSVPVSALLSPAYARARAATIRPDAITPKVTAGDPASVKEGPSTTAIVAADRHGNLVALTQTISDFFGAKVAVPGTGIVLNNEVKNFSSRGVNVMAPGKRMRTTIAPTILIENGEARAALASPGAARIVSTMVWIVSNMVDYGLDVQAAIDLPRLYGRDVEAALHLEGGWPDASLERLRALGYTIEPHGELDLFFGGAQAIVREPRTGRLLGGADPRRDGAVIGY